MKMGRAGRKLLMFWAISKHDKKHKNGCLVTAKVAHAAGLKSSTEVVKMLRELAKDGLIKEVQIEPKYQCGYTVRAWQKVHYEQMSLFSHPLKINGQVEYLQH